MYRYYRAAGVSTVGDGAVRNVAGSLVNRPVRHAASFPLHVASAAAVVDNAATTTTTTTTTTAATVYVRRRDVHAAASFIRHSVAVAGPVFQPTARRRKPLEFADRLGAVAAAPADLRAPSADRGDSAAGSEASSAVPRRRVVGAGGQTTSHHRTAVEGDSPSRGRQVHP